MLTALHHFTMRHTRRIVLKRRFPSSFEKVPILVSSEGGLRYLLKKMKDIDPPLLQLAAEFVKPGAVVWDIGANLGFFSVAAAAKAGSKGMVLALEPDIWLASLLCRTVNIQPSTSARIDVLPVAVAEREDVRSFCISSFARAANHLDVHGSSIAGMARFEQKVVTLSLDWLVEKYPAPQILKIDVEGAEVEVLRGGRGLLAASRPIIICEIRSKNTQPILEILRELHYQIYDAEVAPGARTALSQPSWNTLALPS